MIHFLRATDLWMEPLLAATMFADRRKQFRERMQWPVQVDNRGYERDQYDILDPVYVILEGDDGHHAASMRLLPTTGRTMICEHFSETLDGYKIIDPQVWECTRFCLAPQQQHSSALSILAAGARLMQEAELSGLVAIFNQRMMRVYCRSGVQPNLIGSHNYEWGEVCAGYWSFSSEKYKHLLTQSGIDCIQLELAVANFPIPWCESLKTERMVATEWCKPSRRTLT